MDPRHPELALSRISELISQYDRIVQDIANATVSSSISKLEREGGLVVQEICLVAPRLHEAMMQASRNRRHDLSRGIVEETEKNVEEFKKYVAAAELIDEEVPKEKTIHSVEDAYKVKEPKPKKKRKTTKKKKVE